MQNLGFGDAEMKRTAIALTLVILFLFSFLFGQMLVQPAKSQFLGRVQINPDGSIIGTDKIQHNGNIYTLTSNISEGIQIQKSNILLDGAGYAITGNGTGTGVDLTNNREQDISRPTINNVTVKNLKIINFSLGIENTNAYNNTLINNYIENCSVHGIEIASNGTAVMYNTLKDTNIRLFYVGNNNNITQNNFMNSELIVWMYLEAPLVDRNYWSNYTIRYPDAKELDNTGVWDTPYYVHFGSGFTDYHPLIEPVPIVPEFASWIILPLFMITTLTVTMIYSKKRKRQSLA